MDDDRPKVPQWRIKVAKLLGKIEGKISHFRRTRFKVNLESDFFITQVVRQSNRLLSKIYPNDVFYTQAKYARVSPDDARKLLLYGYTRHIMKVGILLIEEQDLLTENIKNKDTDTLGRAVIEAIVDQQNTLARKLIEILINLINFSNTNVGEMYRMFLSAENLDHFLGRQVDSKDFYAYTSNNTQSSIELYSARIKEDETLVGDTPRWFLKNKWYEEKQPSVFTSARSRYKRAISIAKDEEKIPLGASYFTLFSDLSGSVHPEAGARSSKHYSHKSIRDNIILISLLSLNAISRINELLGIEDPDDMKHAQKDGKSWAPDLVASSFKRSFETGDIVLAGNDLAEIVESKTSQFGYTSCKVRFISQPPLPEYPEDSLPSRMIINVMPKKQVRTFLLRYQNDPTAPPELREVQEMMARESDETLMNLAKKTFLSLYNDGLLFKMMLSSGMMQKREIDE